MAMVLWLNGEFEPYVWCGTDRPAEICGFYLWCQCLVVMKGEMDLGNSCLLQDEMTHEMILRQRTLELGECGSTSEEEVCPEKDPQKHSIWGHYTMMMVVVMLVCAKK